LAIEQRKRLGRGLDALLSVYPMETSDEAPSADLGTRNVPVALIERNRRNPRRDFPPDDMDELAESIRRHGIVQPIVVRPLGGANERYEIIAGERRWRAAQLAGLHEVPVAVIEADDRHALELAIVENVQRSDLNPIEEARGYQALIDEFGYGQADLGTIIGKSRVHVTNTLRLLKLPEPVLAMLESGALSAGHGRALLAAPDPQGLAETIVEKTLSVREAERLAQEPSATSQPAQSRKAAKKSADIAAVEKELSDALGLAVDIRHRDNGRGEMRIGYRTLEQFEELRRRLRQ
jgi:ParB family chromosome partitioning protein